MIEPGAAEMLPFIEVEALETKELLWVNTIKTEARSLLEKYLPEALPQEPTEVVINNMQPFYIGKFKGKHYIALENKTHMLEELDKIGRSIEDFKRRMDANSARRDEEEAEITRYLESLNKRAGAGEIIGEEEWENVPETKSQPEPATEPQEQADWAERLEKGPDCYSRYTWKDVHALIHEMIHQRQAELNPEALPELTSPDIDNIDPETIDRNELTKLLTVAHVKRAQEREAIGGKDSIFYPVIEGMAVIGSYYVMNQLENELATSGNTQTAETVRRAKQEAIYHDLVARRQIRRGEENIDPYTLHYVNGVNMMRKLYKKFGVEQTTQLLKSVDLVACGKIVKNSPEYKAMMEDPTTLPGINTTV